MSLRSRLTSLIGPQRAIGLKVFFGLALVMIALDQLTKMLAWHIFDPVVWLNEQGHFKLVKANASIAIIPGFFQFMFAINTGAAFSKFRDQTQFLTLVSLVISLLVVVWAWRLKPGEWGLRLSQGLILGGALGNLIDRVRLGYVIDFLDAYVIFQGTIHRWPTFNVADSSICVGICLLVIASFCNSQPDIMKNEPVVS